MLRPVILLRAWAISWVILLIYSPSVAAVAPPLETPSGLSFAEIQITGNEFLVIQNNTPSDITDLGSYWIHAFNKTDPRTSGATGSVQQLPVATLGAGQTLLLSSASQNTCGAALVGNLSLSFTDSGGYLEIMKSSTSTDSYGNPVIVEMAGDVVSWSSGSSAGIIKNVQSATPQPVYYRQNTLLPAYSWQKAYFDGSVACQLDVAGSSSPVSTSGLVAAGSGPPAIILSASDYSGGGLPASDIGLEAPQISELLPNPGPPASDSEDEFVELYNSNGATFDLSGFRLEVGTSTTHSYTFPSGTAIGPKSFKAFYSGDTGLSMSNSAGQARLIDPSGNVVSQSDVYGTAKEDQAWALADGKWYWTATPTPNASNIVNQVATSTKTTAKTNSAGSVKSASTTSGGNGATNDGNGVAPAPIHPWTLAGVGAAALLYAGYEYRADLANNLYKLRRYAQSRRAAGK